MESSQIEHRQRKLINSPAHRVQGSDIHPHFDHALSQDQAPGLHHILGHTHHKLLYILSGKLILEGPEDRWLVLPSHIAFIPATREHWITFPESTRLITIYLNPEWTPWTKHGCWVTTVNPLAREMALFGLRWNQYRDPGDGLANQFFRTLGSLCAEWFAKDPLLWLPKGRTPELQRAMDYASAHLENANINDAAKNANISVRTLRRYFLSEVGMSWRDYLINARMVRAMELLLHEGQSVTNTALEVGFSSLGAFTCAFSKFAGQTPSAFAKTHTGARTAL